VSDHPTTALLTLGRLPKALDVARALKSAGLRVLVAEPFAWHLCRASRAVDKSVRVTAPNTDPGRYLDDLARVVEAEGVDLVMPISEEGMHAALLAGRLPARVRLHSPALAVLEELHDKFRFNRLADALGLDVPATELTDAPEAAVLTEAGAYVVKPRLSCSGIGVTFHDRGAVPPLRTATHLLQARVEGGHRASFTIAHEGRVIGTVVYRGTMLSGTVAVCFERLEGERAVEDWVDRFVAATGYSGFVSFDFILDADGRALAIECNPRVTSGVHFVEPASLSAAILRPAEVERLSLRPARRLQQFWPCLTETQGSLFRWPEFKRNLGHLTGTPDVTWTRDDPWPLLTMPLTSYPILARTIFRGESFGAASMHDIAMFSDGRHGP
jgi:predicted ATP-grasp superfamily ATP-dependent carboligase